MLIKTSTPQIAKQNSSSTIGTTAHPPKEVAEPFFSDDFVSSSKDFGLGLIPGVGAVGHVATAVTNGLFDVGPAAITNYSLAVANVAGTVSLAAGLIGGNSVLTAAGGVALLASGAGLAATRS